MSVGFSVAMSFSFNVNQSDISGVVIEKLILSLR